MSYLEQVREKLPSRLFGITLKPPPSNEVSREDYLASLADVDRANVERFVSSLRNSVTGVDLLSSTAHRLLQTEVGVIVFGSSVRPEDQRYHPTRDIDLRILANPPRDSRTNELLWGETEKGILIAVTKILELSRPKPEYSFNPTSTHHLRMVADDRGERVPFMDYNNDDPSFEVESHVVGGLPLHISVSQQGSETLDAHLKEERRHRQYFALLDSFSAGALS